MMPGGLCPLVKCLSPTPVASAVAYTPAIHLGIWCLEGSCLEAHAARHMPVALSPSTADTPLPEATISLAG